MSKVSKKKKAAFHYEKVKKVACTKGVIPRSRKVGSYLFTSESPPEMWHLQSNVQVMGTIVAHES